MNARICADRTARPALSEADRAQRRARRRALLATSLYTLCFFAAVEAAHLLFDGGVDIAPLATSQ